MNDSKHPFRIGLLYGILLLLAGIPRLLAVTNGPFGTQVAQFPRSIVEMVRDPVHPIVYATTSVNTVIAVNTTTMAMQELFIGSNPKGLDLSPDGSRLYVANSGSTTAGIGVVDLTTFQALPSLPTPFAVTSVCVGSSGHLYILSGAQGSAIDQIDSTTGAVQASLGGQSVFVYSGKIQITPDRKTLIYGDFGLSGATLYSIDVSGSTLTLKQKNGTTAGENGEDVEISPDGSALVFPTGGGQGNYDIYLIPTSNVNAAIGSFNLGAYPDNGAFSPDGTTFYTAPSSQSVLQAYSTSTFNLIESYALSGFQSGGGIGRMLVDPSGQYLFASVIPYNSSGYLNVYATGAAAYPVITSPSSVNVDSGVAMSFSLASNLLNVTWSATGLPTGLSVNATSGIVSGTTTAAAGTYNATVTAHLSGGGSTSATLAVTVQTVPTSVKPFGTAITQFNRSIYQMILDPNRPRIYATTANNTVISIDTNTLLITGEVSVGSNPASLDISPDGTLLYVANSGSSTEGVSIIDLTTFEALPGLATSFEVLSLAVGSNGSLYITSGAELSLLTQINATTGAVQATVSEQSVDVFGGNLFRSLDRKTLIYGQMGLSPSTIYSLDISGSTPKVTSSAAGDSDMALSPDGTHIAFASSQSGWAYAPLANLSSTIGTLPTSSSTCGAFSPDGAIFYSASEFASKLQMSSVNTFTNLGSVAAPGLQSLLVDGRGLYLFGILTPASFYGPGSLAVYSTGSGGPLISSPTTLTVNENAPVSYQLTSIESNVTWSATNLPTGLSLGSKSGWITGSIAVPGAYNVTIKSTDQTNLSATATLGITVLTPFTVQISGQGSLQTGSPGTTWVQVGSTYSLTAVAASGAVFNNWTGSVTSSNATISGTVTADMTLTANFAPAAYLNVSVSGPGTVTQSLLGLTVHPSGGAVTISATPSSGGYRFVGWTGDVTSLQSPLTVTVNGTTNLTANFAAIVYPTITSSATLQANENAAVNFALTAAETPVTWSAQTLPAGLSLDAQSGVISGSVAIAGNYSVQVQATDIYGTSDQSILNVFVLASVTLNLNGQGSVTGGSPGANWVAVGDPYSFTAAADPGNSFVGWTGSTSTAAAAISGFVSTDMTFTANFEPSAAVNVGISGPGSVSSNYAGTTTQLVGAQLRIVAMPQAGAVFLGWTGDIVSSDETLNFTVAQATNLAANFASINSFAGSYQFSAGAAAAPGPLTKLGATVNPASKLSGKLAYQGQTFSFSGAFQAATGFAKSFPAKGGKTVQLNLTLSMSSGHPVLTATVNESGTTLTLPGYRSEKIPAGQSVLQKGKYTFLLPPPTNATAVGYGYGTATVAKSGAVSLSGVTGDGAPFTAAAQITDSGFVLLSTPLYGGKGYLDGFLQFRNVPGQSDFDGSIAWSQPAKVAGKTQADAALNAIPAVGSLYSAGTVFNPAAPASEQVTIWNGGLAAQSVTSVTAAGGVITPGSPNSDSLVCAISAKNGAFTGSLVLPGTSAPRPFKGVVFQKTSSAGGCFKGMVAPSYGAIDLAP